jgi:acyl-CoA synthetase (AMP-forming)/AMP-acid ligase II
MALLLFASCCLPAVALFNVINSLHSCCSATAVLQQGELAVRGPMLFREYWCRPQATAEAFDEQGYFMTGDTVSLEGSPPYYRVSCRVGVDKQQPGHLATEFK